MSLLTLDLGEKRVGVAISRSEIIAEPLKTLNFDQDFYQELKNICQQESVEKIVVGLPKSLSGEINQQEKRIREIAAKIAKATKLKTELFDESFSSKMAEERGALDVDQEAAVIILEGYLKEKSQWKKPVVSVRSWLWF